MNKITKAFIVSIVLTVLILPITSKSYAQELPVVTKIDTVSQYRELVNKIISLLLIRLSELQEQLRIEQERESFSIQPPMEPTSYQEQITPEVVNPFSFDVEINGQKTSSIRLPGAPYTKSYYPIHYQVFSVSGNPFSVQVTGFYDNNMGTNVQFSQQFLEQKIYTMDIVATDQVTGERGITTITVDTR